MKILKAIFLVLRGFLMFSCLAVNAQIDCTNWVWAKGLGGSFYDEGVDVCVHSQGDILMTGIFTGDSIQIGSTIYLNKNLGSGNEDVFMARYDKQGNLLYARTFGGTSKDFTKAICADDSGNYYLGGYFESSITFGTFTLFSKGSNDMFIIKFNSSNNVVWAKSYGGKGDDRIYDLDIDPAGNILATGSFKADTFTIGSDTLKNRKFNDICLFKINSSGIPIWARQASGISDETAFGICADQNGNVYVTGQISSNTSFGLINLSAPASSYDVFVSKYNSSGTALWAKSAGTNGEDRGRRICTDNSNNVYFVGEYQNASISFDANTLPNNGAYDVFLAKVDPSGSYLWVKNAGGTGNDRSYDVACNNTGSVYITGEFFSPSITFGTETLLRTGGSDIFVVEYNASNGNVILARGTGGSNPDAGKAICIDNSGDVYVTGRFNSANIKFGVDSLSFHGSNDAFVGRVGNVILTSLSSIDVSCFAYNNASIDLNVNGGTAPYSFSWSNGDTIEDISGIGGGKYTVRVTDKNGCFKDDSTFINEPPEIIIKATDKDVQCFGDTTGSILMDVSGGIPPYSYSWNSGQTTKNIYSLGAGSYILSVSDSVGCIMKDTVVINEPPLLSMSINVVDDSNNTCSGSATAIATGGTPPYSYQWDDPASQTGQTATALCAGTYICIIKDSNNCTVFDSATVVDFIHLVINSSITHVNCYGATNGAVNITVSGGRKPYSYTWSNADTSRDLIGVGAGMYYLTVLDFNGILAEDSFIINQPSQIIISDTVKNEGCEGDRDGAITLGVSGGFPPYSYNWSNGSTSMNISNIGAGKYIVIVSDSVGCSIVSDSIEVSGFPSPKPSISPSENKTICKGESMEVMVLENYNTYQWSNGDLTKSIFVTKTGYYFATVSDNNNCRGNTDTVQISVITNPAQRVNFDTLYYYCRDSAYLEFDAGYYKGAEYLWSPTGDTSYKLKVKEPGTYVITIQIDQCTGSDTFEVQELCYPIVYIPNIFTPGTDGVNDEFFCTSIYAEDFELRIFNKWGALIYEGTAGVDEDIIWNGEVQKEATSSMLYSLAQELRWDGIYKEEIVPAGTYIYVIKYSNIVYGSFSKSGIIQVLR